MDPTKILLPLAALVALTFGVLLMIPLYRVRAARSGRVVVDDFKLGESPNVPADVSIPNVALRACHTLVHLTYNNVLHRLAAFAVSNVVLAITWMRLFAALFR
jgi:hypothetical protein